MYFLPIFAYYENLALLYQASLCLGRLRASLELAPFEVWMIPLLQTLFA